ncbi:protein kinase family protein [Nonomuraea sp. PA05]|uniref:serine/threonine-protein kinase n=1 Tax=Nonomuraea sp. PA05 TaxID=2604466 RepID=UPI0011D8FFFD|nr:serine/threonine-protein kinase [Nonomuraea sp. PA05]TYB54739.1 protein kinase family protein [Nonomuraea sp. PA05]
MMTVKESELGSLTLLSSGGFADVFKVNDYTLPGDPTPLAYKKFTKEFQLQEQTAKQAVAFLESLPEADRVNLGVYSVWPRAVVIADSTSSVTGLLMRLIPDEFFCVINDEKTGLPTSKPRELVWLISSAATRKAAGLELAPVERTERLMMLAQLVYIIGRLHRHGWVFGDISLRNATFALDPPKILLVDCDGAAPLSDANRRQAHTPYWEPPECRPPFTQRLQDTRTDVYKLGLATLRCLTPGKGASTSDKIGRLPAGSIDDTGRALIERAISDDPAARPTAKELYVYLKQAVMARIKVPDVRHLRVLVPYVVRGQDATVEWDIDGASEVVITYGNAEQLVVDPAAHPGGYSFRPNASGRVLVEANNKYGGVLADLGWLMLYEVPEVRIDINLPRPEMAQLDAYQPPNLAATLEGRPRIAVGLSTVEIPDVRPFDFVRSLVPADPVAVFPQDFGASAATASADVTDLIARAGTGMAAVLRPVIRKRLKEIEREGGRP